MRKKRTVIKNKLLLKLLIISIIFILLGIFYIAILSKSNRQLIQENLNTYLTTLNKLDYFNAWIRFLSSNLIFIIFIWSFGISIIGIPIIILFLIYRSFMLGFTISSIIFFYKAKGIIIALIYIIPLLINLWVIIISSYFGIQFSKNLNKLLFLKKEVNFKHVMSRYFKILIFTIICILISSLIEIYLVPNLLQWII